MCHFVTVLRMTGDILHSLPTCIQYETEEKIILEAEKWCRESNNAWPLATKSGRATDRPAQQALLTMFEGEFRATRYAPVLTY